MGTLVTVLPSFSLVPLPPSNLPFNAGQTTVLTDAEFSALPAATARAVVATQTGLPDPVRLPTVVPPQSLLDAVNQAVAVGARASKIAIPVSGTLTVASSPFRYYVETAQSISIVRASVGTAPAGSAIIVDVLKNGSSIFATHTANRPTIAIGANTAVSGAPDITSLAQGDYLTVAVLQIGSATAGANLTVQITTS